MKLYLSSYRIPHPDSLLELIGKQQGEIKAAMITNAKDHYAARARAFKVREAIKDLSDTLPNMDAIDLRDLSSGDEVKETLSGYDVIWVVGGNTFCLRHAMKMSGFDQVIQQLVKDGLVFAGDSAGAVVAGPTLKGVELEDELEFAEGVVWEGLGLIDDFIMPHIDNKLFAASLPPIRQMYAASEISYKELKDSEAFVYKDGQITRVSAAEA